MPKVIQIDLEKLRRTLWGKSADMARQLGIAPENLSRKLRGHHRLTLDELNQIALFLEQDVDAFLVFTSTPSGKEMTMEEQRQDILKELEAQDIDVSEAMQRLQDLQAQTADAEQTVEVTAVLARAQQGASQPPKLSIDEVIRLREHDVEPRWVKALHQAGITDLTVDQVIALADRDVEASWLQELRGLQLANLSFEDVIALAEHDVAASWLKQLQEAGLTGISVSDIIRLAEHDVDVEWLKEMRDLGLLQTAEES